MRHNRAWVSITHPPSLRNGSEVCSTTKLNLIGHLSTVQFPGISPYTEFRNQPMSHSRNLSHQVLHDESAPGGENFMSHIPNVPQWQPKQFPRRRRTKKLYIFTAALAWNSRKVYFSLFWLGKTSQEARRSVNHPRHTHARTGARTHICCPSLFGRRKFVKPLLSSPCWMRDWRTQNVVFLLGQPIADVGGGRGEDRGCRAEAQTDPAGHCDSQGGFDGNTG